MNAVVIPFPLHRRDRARPATAPTLDAGQAIIGRCRGIAFAMNLNHFDRAVLARSVQNWIDFGLADSEILDRATATAKRLAASHRPGPGAA